MALDISCFLRTCHSWVSNRLLLLPGRWHVQPIDFIPVTLDLSLRCHPRPDKVRELQLRTALHAPLGSHAELVYYALHAWRLEQGGS